MDYALNIGSFNLVDEREMYLLDGGVNVAGVIAGVFGILGGICSIVAGVAGLAVPEPTGATKVAGVAGICAGVCGIGAGIASIVWACSD